MKKFILIFLGFLSCQAVLAQGITMTSEVRKKTITQDEELIISYTITGGKEITKLDIHENFSFQITNEFQSYRTDHINNKQPVTTFTKTFTLRPLMTGSFVFPKAQAVVDGFTVYSQPVKVIVLKGTGKNNRARERMVPLSLINENENVEKKVNDNIEVVQTINKNTCYVGENIASSIKLYARLRAQYGSPKLPTYNGFSMEDQYNNYRISPVIVQYKGKEYSMNEVRSVHLFPLNEGELTIDPFVVEATIPLQRQSAGGMSYENFNYKATLQSNPLNIKVLPLPSEGKPASFNGAVGNFRIYANITGADTLHAEDPVQLEIIIEGQGNLPLIHLPSWQVPDEVSAGQTSIQTDYIKDEFPFQGRKKFTIPFYVKKAGTTTIPSIEFSYFDPAKKQYIALRTEPFEMNVLPATLQNRRAVEDDTSSLNKRWLLLLLPVIIIGTYFMFRKSKTDKEVSVEAIVPLDNVKKVSQSTVLADMVKRAYWDNNHQVFYKQLQDYLVTLIEEKDEIKILNQRSLDQYLSESSFQTSQRTLIQQLYAQAQYNRFSQLANQDDYVKDFQLFEKLTQSL